MICGRESKVASHVSKVHSSKLKSASLVPMHYQ